MRICIFPGTFNPIHNAHISMAEYSLGKYGFDKVIFVPAYLPPHKDVSKSLSKHRYNMVKLAIAGNKKFEISDFEYNNGGKSGGKSYSIYTVKHFISEYNIKGKIDFIIGTDAFIKIKSWYNAEELKNLVHFIVFKRQGTEDSSLFEYLAAEGWDFEFAGNDFYDVSSTKIRNELTKHDISDEVEDYIKNNGLYS